MGFCLFVYNFVKFNNCFFWKKNLPSSSFSCFKTAAVTFYFKLGSLPPKCAKDPEQILNRTIYYTLKCTTKHTVVIRCNLKPLKENLFPNRDQILSLSLFRIPPYYENMRFSILTLKQKNLPNLLDNNKLYIQRDKAGRKALDLLFSASLGSPHP